jgi:sugar phosphate isomerase/epimerase
MKTKQGWPLGVCSWSLQQDLNGVVSSLRGLGVEHVHLAVGPALEKNGGAYLDAALAQRWTVTSAMIGFPQEDYSSLDAIRRTGGIVPDAEWPSNRKLFVQAADVAVKLKTPYLSMHAGFIEHGNKVFADRMKCLADAAGERKLTLLMETGQERAAELRAFLEELAHPAVGLNFDPANMILYDKDAPADALKILGPWIRHVHIKDAVRTQKRGEWGAEVPWGDGEVGAKDFLAALAVTGFNGAVAIEREAGEQRLPDIRLAVTRLV